MGEENYNVDSYKGTKMLSLTFRSKYKETQLCFLLLRFYHCSYPCDASPSSVFLSLNVTSPNIRISSSLDECLNSVFRIIDSLSPFTS